MGTDTRVPINHHAAIVIINDGRQHQYIPVYRDDTGWHTWKEGARIVQHPSMDAARRFIQAKEQEEHGLPQQECVQQHSPARLAAVESAMSRVPSVNSSVL